ncbi:MAG: TlpA family protein disulfide reductase [Gammaproteobacteria bacterium]|nr:TlpA family protein disulfide reductase [Gammaproteobacteria bacterium]
MKKIAPIIIIALAIIAYFIFGTASLRSAPALSMTTLNGHTLHTTNRNNKPLLLTFWATTCSSCVKEMPHLIDMQNRLADQLDIAGIAMSYDNPEHINEMVKRRSLNYNIVYDQSGDIAQAFGGIRLTPTSFLISPQGQIVYQKIGDIDFKKLEQDIHNLKTKTTG